MTPVDQAVLNLIAAVLMIEGPISVAAAVFLWKLHGESRDLDNRVPKPRLRLSLILAVTGTIGAVASAFLAVASAAYLFGGDQGIGIVRQLGVLVQLTFPVLGLVSIINALYLRWLAKHGDIDNAPIAELVGVPAEELHMPNLGSDGEPLSTDP